MEYDGRMPAGGRYVGKDAVFGGYFPKMLANFAEFHASAEEYLDAGGSIVVLGRYSGKSKRARNSRHPLRIFMPPRTAG